jgi:hypothetical protein
MSVMGDLLNRFVPALAGAHLGPEPPAAGLGRLGEVVAQLRGRGQHPLPDVLGQGRGIRGLGETAEVAGRGVPEPPVVAEQGAEPRQVDQRVLAAGPGLPRAVLPDGMLAEENGQVDQVVAGDLVDLELGQHQVRQADARTRGGEPAGEADRVRHDQLVEKDVHLDPGLGMGVDLALDPPLAQPPGRRVEQVALAAEELLEPLVLLVPAPEIDVVEGTPAKRGHERAVPAAAQMDGDRAGDPYREAAAGGGADEPDGLIGDLGRDARGAVAGWFHDGDLSARAHPVTQRESR